MPTQVHRHPATSESIRTPECQAEQDIAQEETEQNMRAVIYAWASPIHTLERYSSDDAFVQHGLHFNGHPAGSQGLGHAYPSLGRKCCRNPRKR